MKSKSWPWAEMYPISSESLMSHSGYLTALQNWKVWSLFLLLTAVVMGLMCLFSKKIQSFLQDQSVPPTKSIFVFILFLQSRTNCSIGRYLSIFSLLELFVFHMLQKIRWIFLKGIDLSIEARWVIFYELQLWMLVILQLGSQSRATYSNFWCYLFSWWPKIRIWKNCLRCRVVS